MCRFSVAAASLSSEHDDQYDCYHYEHNDAHNDVDALTCTLLVFFCFHNFRVSCSNVLVNLGHVLIDLFDVFGLFDKFLLSVVLDLFDVCHHPCHSIEIILVLVNHLGLEFSFSFKSCGFYVSLLLELLLLNLGFVVRLIVIVVRLMCCLLVGSSTLSELHVLLHLLLDFLFKVPKPYTHVVVAPFESLFFIFQFFLVFVLYLDGVEIVEFWTKAFQRVF